MAVNPQTPPAIDPNIQAQRETSLANANAAILDMISKQSNLDKMMVLMEFLKSYDIDVDIAGEKKKVNSQEFLTELPNVNYTKTLTKNETWRRTVKEHFHLPHIDDEKIVGAMDKEFLFKMIAHKRKREQAIINGLKNDIAGTEVIPQNTKRKRFFGMI